MVYVGTGENYSTPANDMSDAIIALQQETGEIVWVQQTIEGDAWNGACVGPKVNCPEEDGPDFDFGASRAEQSRVNRAAPHPFSNPLRSRGRSRRDRPVLKPRYKIVVQRSRRRVAVRRFLLQTLETDCL